MQWVKKMNDLTIGFIGFGLIGGSIARAIKETHPTFTLLSYHYSNGGMGKGLEDALEDHVLDFVYRDLQEGFSSCDIIFLCAPVLSNITYLEQLKDIIKPSCIITDVGSVKSNIHEAVEDIGLKQNFIGGHPMAGSEKTGYENSHSKLLENAYYILTPTDETPSTTTETLYQLVQSIGAIPLVLDYKEHDNVTAAISHLPHLIATSLVNLVKESDDSEENMRTLAAGGFKDITRIASSSPTMWQDICLTNTKSIQYFLDKYITSLKDIYHALDEKNEKYIFDLFDTAGEYRDSIPNKFTGILSNVYEIYIDIYDEAGSIATVATLLASNQISIKNIGIIHNREFQQGVLRIEFYEEKALIKAVELLKKYRYTVYER
jgi:prephenate dehydrogenase